MSSKVGILLVNLGTPNSPSTSDVRKYLREFLYDPRVIELPAFFRWILLNIIILPFRSKKSAKAYQSIWQESGSPLLVNSLAIKDNLQNLLGGNFKVVLAMRYGSNKILEAIKQLQDNAIDNIVIIPLFPQYASAVSGSVLQEVLNIFSKQKVIPSFKVVCDFFEHPEYIKALAKSISPYLNQEHDFLLMSYHGLPERQLINPGVSCYRTQCLQTSNLLAKELQLSEQQWSVSFQSRLGRLPWIKPYTDDVLIELRSKGVNNLLVCCPSFVADCLETLEEIGIRAKEQWQELGGKNFSLIPCLNSQPDWIYALKAIALHQ